MIINFRIYETRKKLVPCRKPIKGITMKNPLNAMSKSQAANFIYNITESVVKGIFKDEWGQINKLMDIFSNSGLEWDIYEKSKYFNFPPPDNNYESIRKEWYPHFIFIDNKGKIQIIKSTIMACAMDREFNKYDIIFTIHV